MFTFGRSAVLDIFVWCFLIPRLSLSMWVLILLKYSATEMWFHQWNIICASSFVQGQIITYRNCQAIHTVKVTFFSCPYKGYGCENCNYFLDDVEKLYSVEYIQRAVALQLKWWFLYYQITNVYANILLKLLWRATFPSMQVSLWQRIHNLLCHLSVGDLSNYLRSNSYLWWFGDFCEAPN